MAHLRAREQQGRSLRILVNPIDECVGAACSHAHIPHYYYEYKRKLLEKLKESRERFEESPEWPHKSNLTTDDRLESSSNRINQYAVAQLSLANPWPTREMSEPDVFVEDTFPYDVKKFLPLPLTNDKSLHHSRSILVPYFNVALWIKGVKKITNVDNLIQDNDKTVIDVIRTVRSEF
ncbi:unnamed protein product [Rotaria magnacalcarata]|uniref:Uncharacterized protein n=1 Tax=Rotaria magnacalcarata TaxID=392030 RepID=A0A815YZ86_9BILA|nr:unnamed protein product [Rotaria magnacalcarata]CAF1588293.1 unnamed protein product [Rotaria magnacalcarata]CAF3930499.1 unnamed protein product [Rotaria magnacalcarata]CAF3945267.1 unnamed protein product [Rotaria magnacalcarata]CAF3979664.1 unnamed protein product [Rotaria magnacalcarata]